MLAGGLGHSRISVRQDGFDSLNDAIDKEKPFTMSSQEEIRFSSCTADVLTAQRHRCSCGRGASQQPQKVFSTNCQRERDII